MDEKSTDLRGKDREEALFERAINPEGIGSSQFRERHGVEAWQSSFDTAGHLSTRRSCECAKLIARVIRIAFASNCPRLSSNSFSGRRLRGRLKRC